MRAGACPGATNPRGGTLQLGLDSRRGGSEDGRGGGGSSASPSPLSPATGCSSLGALLPALSRPVCGSPPPPHPWSPFPRGLTGRHTSFPQPKASFPSAWPGPAPLLPWHRPLVLLLQAYFGFSFREGGGEASPALLRLVFGSCPAVRTEPFSSFPPLPFPSPSCHPQDLKIRFWGDPSLWDPKGFLLPILLLPFLQLSPKERERKKSGLSLGFCKRVPLLFCTPTLEGAHLWIELVGVLPLLLPHKFHGHKEYNT